MKRCWKCGTYEVFTTLVALASRVWWTPIPSDYFECLDENECFRREQMKMGPGMEWPGLGIVA